MTERSNYILLATDTADVEDKYIYARQIVGHRLHRRLWPLYQRTRYRGKITAGDRCLIYVGGRGPDAQCLVASAVVNSVDSDPTDLSIDPSDIVNDVPATVLKLSDIIEFPQPVSMRALLDVLRFIPSNKKKWGAVLQGGCLKISDGDFETITSIDR